MTQFYTDTSRELDTYRMPNAEVFYVEEGEWYYDDNGERHDPSDFPDEDTAEQENLTACETGYYYWYCLPGCMPDSDPHGPFETEELAIADAREQEGSD